MYVFCDAGSGTGAWYILGKCFVTEPHFHFLPVFRSIIQPNPKISSNPLFPMPLRLFSAFESPGQGELPSASGKPLTHNESGFSPQDVITTIQASYSQKKLFLSLLDFQYVLQRGARVSSASLSGSWLGLGWEMWHLPSRTHSLAIAREDPILAARVGGSGGGTWPKAQWL